MDPRSAWAVGFAMNARGAMEIVLSTLALRAGLIGNRMFVALVVMALFTSLVSAPAIQELMWPVLPPYLAFASDVEDAGALLSRDFREGG